jgi:hypothetical protein
LGEAGAFEGERNGFHERTEIARQAQDLGWRDLLAAAAQQRRRDNGEIGRAHLLQASADLGKIGETEAVFDFGQGAEGEQEAVAPAAGGEFGFTTDGVGHVFAFQMQEG